MFKYDQDITIDLTDLATKLNVSVLSKDFGVIRFKGEKVMSLFVTNDFGRPCVFYNVDFPVNELRIIITKTFAKYILTGEKRFQITRDTDFTAREKELTYELLMPESQVRAMCKKLLLPTTFALAKIFNVTQEFVRERLDAIDKLPDIAGYNY